MHRFKTLACCAAAFLALASVAEAQRPNYRPVKERARAIWPGGPEARGVRDLMKVTVKLPNGQKIVAPTHLFGKKMRVIPYADGITAQDAKGNQVRGGQEISRYIRNGDVAYMIKHHRPEHRVLEVAGDGGADMKEHFKLQDTHIGIVVGVKINGKQDAVSLNNPQSYQDGRFGDAHYPMVFVKPSYPKYLNRNQRKAFRNNIRTMTLLFNAVSNFPGNYNGGDPLSTPTPERLRKAVGQAILAVAGSDAEKQAAKAFFRDPKNQLYCAELAFAGASGGMHVPLNKTSVKPLLVQGGLTEAAADAAWKQFAKVIQAHNRGEATPLTTMNDNGFAKHVKARVAPAGLKAAPQYAPESQRAAEGKKLALNPMTAADMVQNFLATHIPRQKYGESMGPVQAALLEKMKPGLMEQAGLSSLPENSPQRQAFEGFWRQVIPTVQRDHGSYANFRRALEPLMGAARQMTGPRPGADPGDALYTPPNLFHLVAQDRHTGGMLGMKYVGHGLHFSAMEPIPRQPRQQQQPRPAPAPAAQPQ
jgi:hypothetical protein